jgi:hypothetical protein
VLFLVNNRRKQSAPDPSFFDAQRSSSHLGASAIHSCIPSLAAAALLRSRAARSRCRRSMHHFRFRLACVVASREGAGFRGEAARRGRKHRRARAASSVLKFDIAVLFNRNLLERFHRAFQQRDVVGIPRLAVDAAARGLGARDTLLLLADLATRQMFEGRGRNVGGGNIIGLACAGACERGESSGNVCAKARDFARSGLWQRRRLHAATYGASSPRRVEERALPGIVWSAKAEKIPRHFFPFNSLISVTSSGNG